MNRKELYGLFAVLAVVAAGLALQSVVGPGTGSSFRILPGQATPGLVASAGATPSSAAGSPFRSGTAIRSATQAGAASAESAGKSDAFRVDGRLDLNRASVSDLQAIDRVGKRQAQAIVAYRERKGPFHDLRELGNVSGIGEKTRQALEPFLFVEAPAKAAPTTEANSTTTATIAQVGVTVPETSSGEAAPVAGAVPISGTEIGAVGSAAPPTSAALAATASALVSSSAPVTSTSFKTAAAAVPAVTASPTPLRVSAPTPVPPVAPAPARATASAAKASKSTKPAAAVRPVNINTADETELAALWNVGPAKAKAIVQWRLAHGAFRRPEDLDNVPGIGPETVRRNLPLIVVGPER